MLRIKDSSLIRVDNITFTDPGFWCVVPTHSEDITITNLRVTASKYSPNTDGVEPMWSRNVLLSPGVGKGDSTPQLTMGASRLDTASVPSGPAYRIALSGAVECRCTAP